MPFVHEMDFCQSREEWFSRGIRATASCIVHRLVVWLSGILDAFSMRSAEVTEIRQSTERE